MKKTLVVLTSIFLLTGCFDSNATTTDIKPESEITQTVTITDPRDEYAQDFKLRVANVFSRSTTSSDVTELSDCWNIVANGVMRQLGPEMSGRYQSCYEANWYLDSLVSNGPHLFLDENWDILNLEDVAGRTNGSIDLRTNKLKYITFVVGNAVNAARNNNEYYGIAFVLVERDEKHPNSRVRVHVVTSSGRTEEWIKRNSQ